MSSPSDIKMLAGGCYCGRVGYQVDDAFDYALICHCGNCRRTTGSAFKPFAGIPRARLALTHGADQVLIYGDDLTNNTHCATCGSLLYSVVRNGQWVHVAMGTLIDTPAIRPTAHIFVGSKAPWHEITDDLPQYQEFPGMSLIGQPVTIIGAGVAGLALARALALRGADVTVLEQADAIREVGAGLQISPNGAAVLRGLGLQAELDAASMRADAVALIDGPSGEGVTRLDLARLRPGHGYHFLHRADLIALLLTGAEAAGVKLRLLSCVSEVDLSGPAPAVQLDSGERVDSPLVIGADGLHSKTRAALNGVETPFFTRQVAWRAVIPCEPGAAPVAEVNMGPGRHLVSYPLRGGSLRNIVAVEERDRWAEESWTLRDDAITLRVAFEGFSPRVRGWLDRVEDPWLWGLFRHQVAGAWVKPMGQGGVAILGDAAHPTLPFLAQGASMGLEDAWVLAHSLASHDSPAAALAAYQSLRKPRATRIVAAANANARAYHLSGLPRMIGHTGLRLLGRLSPGTMLSRFDWLYDHDVTL